MQELVSLENETRILVRMRKIRNELLSNGAYHTVNLESQIKRLESLKVPDNEIKLVERSNSICCKLSHKLMKQYNELMDNIERWYLNGKDKT